MSSKISLLGAAEIRELAAKLDLRPTKKLGQNFVIDGNTCQKIVKISKLESNDLVLEVGPGLGSLTLAILEIVDNLQVIEIDQRLANMIGETVNNHGGGKKELTVYAKDALEIKELKYPPTALVANLPYNVSVPVLLTLLQQFPSIEKGVVMVQAEVADRLTAAPNTAEYGAPTLKAKWWANLVSQGFVSRKIFWPIPNVDSKLVEIQRISAPGDEVLRKKTYALIDAAFAMRRKMLRSSLAPVLEGNAEQILLAVGVDPTARGETLDLADYVKIASVI